MIILIAPDKFKGSLSSLEVIEAITNGVKRAYPEAQIESQRLADGGEGSLEILEETLGLKRIELTVNDPLFRPISTFYLTDDKRAFIEMAAASGLLLLSENERNPMNTSTFGTGELIRHALKSGCREINLLIGGSATNDCGLGMAKALGFQFFDKDQQVLEGTGADLERVASFSQEDIESSISKCQFNVLTDVQNPLLGEEGAAHVYAAQKGADLEMIEMLENGAKNLVEVLANGKEKINGAGAAGGLGYGAMSFLNAKVVSGINFMLDLTEMEEKVRNADLVITGEGSVDEQSLQGKVIAGLQELCQLHQKPMAIVCGISTLNSWNDLPIYQVMNKAENIEDAMKNTGSYVEILTKELIQDFNSKNA